jgi:hypothetical protein
MRQARLVDLWSLLHEYGKKGGMRLNKEWLAGFDSQNVVVVSIPRLLSI